jgi:hypothetical protein
MSGDAQWEGVRAKKVGKCLVCHPAMHTITPLSHQPHVVFELGVVSDLTITMLRN